MAATASNVRVFGAGAVYVDLAGTATAPTSSSSALGVGWTDLGYTTTDGSPTLTIPVSTDKTVIQGWPNLETVRIVRTPTQDVPTLQVVLMETSLAVIRTAFGVTPAQTATDGSFVFNAATLRPTVGLVFDGIDGSEIERYYAPKARVTAVDAIKLSGTDVTSYAVTWDFERDDTLQGNFKSWMTALKS